MSAEERAKSLLDSELLACNCGECRKNFTEVMSRSFRAAESAARAGAIEEAARVVCARCRNGAPTVRVGDNTYHITSAVIGQWPACEASDIRSLLTSPEQAKAGE